MAKKLRKKTTTSRARKKKTSRPEIKEYQVKLTLSETIDGKTKQKHSKSLKVNLTKEAIEKYFDKWKDRGNQTLTLSAHEYTESGRASRVPFIKREIFPGQNIQYLPTLRKFENLCRFEEAMEKKDLVLFEYFLKTKGFDPKKQMKAEPYQRKLYDYRYRDADQYVTVSIAVDDHTKIEKLKEDWQNNWLWQNRKEKILQAVGDPATNSRDMKRFKVMLEEYRIFQKEIVDDKDFEIIREADDLDADEFDNQKITVKVKSTGKSITMTRYEISRLSDMMQAFNDGEDYYY